MNSRMFFSTKTLFNGAALALCAALVLPTLANATVPAIEVEVKPAQGSETVSVSRPGVAFNASFQVKVTSSGNLQKFSLYGNSTVLDSDGNLTAAVGTFVPTGPCKNFPARDDYNKFQAKCTIRDLVANVPAYFTVTFITPTSGSKLNFDWTKVRFKVSDKHDSEDEEDDRNNEDRGVQQSGGGSSDPDITLITQTSVASATGFKTYVPATGGTFFTGVDGGLGAAAPGGVATQIDPFTTTVVIPAIQNPTTAEAVETVSQTSCSPNFGQCFESNLTIPVPGNTNPLTIYLRIDSSRITAGALIASATIFYDHDPTDQIALIQLENCSATVVPQVGRPCIAARKRYSLTVPQTQWRGDWEFKILALDNGRFLF